jgi:hypothetical protein
MTTAQTTQLKDEIEMSLLSNVDGISLDEHGEHAHDFARGEEAHSQSASRQSSIIGEDRASYILFDETGGALNSFELLLSCIII